MRRSIQDQVWDVPHQGEWPQPFKGLNGALYSGPSRRCTRTRKMITMPFKGLNAALCPGQSMRCTTTRRMATMPLKGLNVIVPSIRCKPEPEMA